MAQITIRAADDLVLRVKREAASTRRSMNEYVAFVLDVATDPSLEGDEVERLRARLRAGGLLDDPPPEGVSRPPDAAFETARRAAGRGTPLSELVSEGRGP